MSDDLDHADSQPGPDEPNDRVPAEEPERETRGVLSILGPTALGAVAGAIVGALVLLRNLGGTVGMDVAAQQGALEGAVIGAIIGGIGGVLRWAFFPYMGRAEGTNDTAEKERGGATTETE